MTKPKSYVFYLGVLLVVLAVSLLFMAHDHSARNLFAPIMALVGGIIVAVKGWRGSVNQN